jgi:hypothetical protein
MKPLTLRRCALSVCVTAILLAGCSQSNSALPQSNAGAQMRLEQLTPEPAQSPAGAGSAKVFLGAYYAATARSAKWSEFGFIASGGRFNPHEHILSPRNAHRLHKRWSSVRPVMSLDLKLNKEGTR